MRALQKHSNNATATRKHDKRTAPKGDLRQFVPVSPQRFAREVAVAGEDPGDLSFRVLGAPWKIEEALMGAFVFRVSKWGLWHLGCEAASRSSKEHAQPHLIPQAVLLVALVPKMFDEGSWRSCSSCHLSA